MLDYSRALYKKILADISFLIKAYGVFDICMQLLFIAYQTYILLIGSKIWYIHLALLILSSFFFIFSCFITNAIKTITSDVTHKKTKKQLIKNLKSKKKSIKQITTYVSFTLKAFIIITSVYTIASNQNDASIISIITTTLAVVALLLNILLKIATGIIEKKKNIITEALKADFAEPLVSIKDKFNKLIHKDIEIQEKPEPTKERKYLDGLVQSIKDEKAAKKAEEKSQKSEKLSSWLDSHLSKITAKRGAKEADETETSEDNSDLD